MSRPRALPRRRLFGADAKNFLLTGAAMLVAACIAAVVVMYPDGIASWDRGHLSVSLDR